MHRHIFGESLHYCLCAVFLIALLNLSLQVFITPPRPNIVLEGFKYQNGRSKWWIKLKGDWSSDNVEYNATKLIAQNGNDYSVLSNHVAAIAFICRASSPIFWTMDNAEPKVLTDINTFTRVKLNENSKNLEPIEFQSYLVLGNWASLTGQYTCQYSHNKTNNASLYLFFGYATDQDKSIFVTPQRELTVGFNGKQTLVLPCRVSRKDVNVKLLIKENNSTDETNDTTKSEWISPGLFQNNSNDETNNTTKSEWIFPWVSLNNSKGETNYTTKSDWVSPAFVPKFNPKVGFIIDRTNTPQLPVSFKCVVDVHTYTEENVIIHVEHEYLEKPKELEYRNNKAGKANWKRKPFGDGIKCCSNSSISPKFHVVTCESQPHCDMIKKAYISMEWNTSRTPGLIPLFKKVEEVACLETASYLFVLPFFLECVGDGIDVAEEYKTKFVSPANKMISFVSVPNGHIPEYLEETTVRARILKVINKTSSLQIDLLDFEKVDPEFGIFRGENYVFDCCGLHAYHAVGRIQRIGWKNGSTTLLNEIDHQTGLWNPLYKDFCFTYSLSPDEDDIGMIVDENMSYFECIIPYWNDTRPFVKRMNMIVREYKEPILKLNNQTFNITYDENQFGLLHLDCTTNQGDPVPEFKWTKNGYKVNWTDKFWSVVNDLRPDLPTSGSILLFMRAVKEIEGKYECFGDNGVGSVRKSFSVRVKPRSYVDYWIAFFLFGGFFLLMIITAIKISIQEQRLGNDNEK